MLLTVLSFILFFISLYYYSNNKKENKFKDLKKKLPGVNGTLNACINAFLAICFDKNQENAIDKFNKINEAYGDVAYIRIGSATFLTIRDYELVKKVLNSPDWTNRVPRKNGLISHRSFGKEYGIVFNNYNRSSKEMRKFSIKTLREFGFGKEKSLESSLEDELKYFTQFIRDLVKNEGPIVQMRHFFNLTALNVVWTMFAGTRFCYDDKKLIFLTNILGETAKNNKVGDVKGALALSSAFPLLFKIIMKIHPFEDAKMSENFQKFIRDILEERRVEGYYKTDQRDFIDVFLKEIDNHKNDPPETNLYTDEQFIVTAMDFFFAGSDTTSATLEYGFSFLVQNPEIRKKIQKEIDTVVGRDRFPSVLDRSLMPYTEAALCEILRMAPAIPLPVRAPIRETELGGYIIPQNVHGVLNLYAIQMSEKIWMKPKEFRPERFLDENNQLINTEKVMSFGGGRRLCIGETIARATLFTYLTTLLQQFDFEVSEEHGIPSCEPELGFTLLPQKYYAKIRERYN